ncbi:MAG: HAD-IB family hydrolase [Nitrospirae bacterium]|nr:HAD-IB family hydrolase [Nitrospirota bacterium]
MKKTAAFFDLDHTVIRESTGRIFTLYLYRKGYVKEAHLARLAWYELMYRLNMMDYKKMIEYGLEIFHGMRASEVVDLIDECFERHMKPRIFVEAKEIIEQHRLKGHLVVFNTASLRYMVERFQEFFGVHYALCSSIVLHDGFITGHVGQICYGAEKAKLAREFALERHVDLSQSYFYTDSLSDLPLMEEVGYPKVVNPQVLMRREAEKRGWEILKFQRTVGGPRGAL